MAERRKLQPETRRRIRRARFFSTKFHNGEGSQGCVESFKSFLEWQKRSDRSSMERSIDQEEDSGRLGRAVNRHRSKS